jgi:fumarate reductase subunit D
VVDFTQQPGRQAKERREIDSARAMLHRPSTEVAMVSPIVLLLVVILLIAALPTWPHSQSWGYFPSGGLGLLLLILLVLALFRAGPT